MKALIDDCKIKTIIICNKIVKRVIRYVTEKMIIQIDSHGHIDRL